MEHAVEVKRVVGRKTMELKRVKDALKKPVEPWPQKE